MITRHRHLTALSSLLDRYPVVAILGARQVGKTTLARDLVTQRGGPSSVYDLENPIDLAILADPMLALQEKTGLVVLDEIQRAPEIFRVLRVLADRPGTPARFLVLGSASPELLRQGSESLAGRIAFYELPGFALDEVGVSHLEPLWVRGGFPRSFLADSDQASSAWRHDLVRTFLERDLPQLGIRIPGPTLGRFWSMLAHYHGQTWNASELARSFGVADTTVRGYLDVLVSTFVVRSLPPWHENLSKRQVKAPKIYLTDSGILHALLDLETEEDIVRHPKSGASWEGFALETVVSRLRAPARSCYFWATHQGAELDLLVVKGRRRYGFEFKRTVAPRVTRSAHVALEDLKLTRLDLVHAGDATFPLGDRIRALALKRVLEDLEALDEPPSTSPLRGGVRPDR